MAEKDKDKEAQAPTPSVEEEAPKVSDHSSLVSALKEAFTKDREIPQPKIGMDETIPGGKYVKFGTLVNANGEPIDESGKVLKKD